MKTPYFPNPKAREQTPLRPPRPVRRPAGNSPGWEGRLRAGPLGPPREGACARRLKNSRFFFSSELLGFSHFIWWRFALSAPAMARLEELEQLKKSLGEEAEPPAELWAERREGLGVRREIWKKGAGEAAPTPPRRRRGITWPQRLTSFQSWGLLRSVLFGATLGPEPRDCSPNGSFFLLISLARIRGVPAALSALIKGNCTCLMLSSMFSWGILFQENSLPSTWTKWSGQLDPQSWCGIIFN